MTTKELFDEIQERLKEKGELPDILDYARADSSPAPIKTCEFNLPCKRIRRPCIPWRLCWQILSLRCTIM